MKYSSLTTDVICLQALCCPGVTLMTASIRRSLPERADAAGVAKEAPHAALQPHRRAVEGRAQERGHGLQRRQHARAVSQDPRRLRQGEHLTNLWCRCQLAVCFRPSHAMHNMSVCALSCPRIRDACAKVSAAPSAGREVSCLCARVSVCCSRRGTVWL